MRMLIVGDDKIGRKLLSLLNIGDDWIVVKDKSSSPKRIFKLLQKGVLKPTVLVKMVFAEVLRRDYKGIHCRFVKSNQDILRLLEENKLTEILMFRAGLIINRRILSAGIPVKNIHCARIPDFGGIGSIHKALAAAAYDQEATLHRVTERIDDGEILDTEPFILGPNLSYRENEDIAYEAGIRLALRVTQSTRQDVK
jgi:methionyl-tRNA formyltransferase